MRYLLLFFIITGTNFTASATTSVVQYQFKPIDTAHHLAQVTITYPDVSTKTLEIKLPVWRSGRYEILDLSKAVNYFSARHINGQTIQFNKTDKNTWKLYLNHPGTITVSYQVYANSLKQRVIHLDNTHAFLDASGVFMYSPTYRNQALEVHLDVPDSWRSRSGMTQISAHSFKAANYDQLVDSPIESGLHEFLAFEHDGIDYEIVVWGEGNHDINDLKDQIRLMHDEVKKVWHTFPYERYVFMYHLGDHLRGATEHVNSTIIQQSRFNFKPRKSYLKVLATTAHELVHTWNVKAYRPAGIAPYDYSKENYSDLFWMAEGITSYYDDLLLLRSGIYQPKEYFDVLSQSIQDHLSKPGREVESLAQTSFDTWLKDDVQQTHNASTSIYLEGQLLAWRLDQEIRQLTNNQFGLDELQLRLYQQHRNIDRGYHKNDVLNHLKDITGSDMTHFWNQFIENTQAIDFDQLLSFYGLQRTYKDTDDENEAGQAWIGAALDLNDKLIQIKTVDSGSPAWLAGLNAGDQLLAIDGIQVTSKNIEKRIKQLDINKQYDIHFFNAGRLRETQLTAIENPHPEFKIEPIAKPSKKQKARFKAWTGLDLIQD